MESNDAPYQSEIKGLWIARLWRPMCTRTALALLAALIIAGSCHYHYAPRTRLVFEVRMDGQIVKDEFAYGATLGAVPIKSGNVVSVGRHEFRVTMPDAIPFHRRIFVRYGTNDLGQVDLTRNRAQLNLLVKPAAKRLELSGPYEHLHLTNSSGTTASIPVGRYAGLAHYDYFTEKFVLTVATGQSKVYRIEPAVGAVRLTSQPAGAQFQLTSIGRKGVDIKGDAPTLAAPLPEGSYRLRMWRDHYLRETNFTLKRGLTNTVEIVFEYGEITVISQPDHAVIYTDGKAAGRTPATFRYLRPGHYQFRLEQPGYYPAEWSTDVRARSSLVLATNLISYRFSNALDFARLELTASAPNYPRALESIEVALVEKPGDPEATALKTKLEDLLKEAERRQAERNKAEEREARQRHPAVVFQQFAEKRRYAELFPTQSLHLRAQLEQIRAAVLRALAARPPWNVLLDTQPDDHTCLLEADFMSLVQGKRNVVVVAGQVTDEDVDVFFKIWDYALDKNTDPSPVRGVTGDNYLPVHPDYLKTEETAAIAARRNALVEEFKTKILKEIK